MTNERYWGRVLQDGLAVAWASAPDRASMLRDLHHYAAVYGQDGPVRTQVRSDKGRWKDEA